MIEFPKPNVFISKCLGFEHCRWNSAIISDTFISKLLPHINYTTTCPELDIGLGVPRNPIRIIQIEDELHLIQHSTGKDVSEEMLKFADEYLTSIKSMNLDGFILKNRSPSCGIKDVKIYPKVEKSAALTKKASGFFGGKIYEHFPYLPIEDEGRLKNDEIRENFLTKLFLFARFRKIKEKQEFNALVDFHRTNKYLLRIYSQKERIGLTFVRLIEDDPAFDIIRNEPEFQQIVADIEAKYQAEHERVRKWLEENDML